MQRLAFHVLTNFIVISSSTCELTRIFRRVSMSPLDFSYWALPFSSSPHLFRDFCQLDNCRFVVYDYAHGATGGKVARMRCIWLLRGLRGFWFGSKEQRAPDAKMIDRIICDNASKICSASGHEKFDSRTFVLQSRIQSKQLTRFEWNLQEFSANDDFILAMFSFNSR